MRFLFFLLLLSVAADVSAAGAGGPAPKRQKPQKIAEASPEYTTIVRGARHHDGLDAQRRVDARTPGFAAAIEVDTESGARPADALPEVVARSPGVAVRSIGGLGQFTSISIRGSTGQQVSIFLDGVPLGSSLGGLVNVAAIPLDTIGVIEVYRGYVPVVFGGATIGGAINLVGKVYRGPPTVGVSAGYGSFQTREARAVASLPITDHESLIARIGYAGTEGAFKFFDNNGTPQFRRDDQETIRANNGFDRILGQLRMDGRRGAWRYGAQQLGLWRQNGVPGRATVQSEFAGFKSLGLQTTAYAKRTGTFLPTGTFEARFGLGFQNRRFEDPKDEVGIAINNQRTQTVDLYVSPRLRLPLWSSAFFLTVFDGRAEWIDVENLLEVNPLTDIPSGDAKRKRFSGGVGFQLEQFLFDTRLAIIPAVRLDVIHSLFSVPVGEGEQDDDGQDTTFVGASPRLGVKFRLLDWLQLRASGGRYFRPPTLHELFGDQGFAVGNEGLLPESGTSIDSGFVVDIRQGSALSLHGQVAGFVTFSEDLIQWIGAGSTTRPNSVPGARVAGLELGLSLRAWNGRIRAHGNYTFTDSRNENPEPEQFGKPLPGRPKHFAFGRVSVGERFSLLRTLVHPRVFYSVEHVSGTFLDPSGRRLVPQRTIHAVGAELTFGRLRLAFEARNLLDVRTTTWTPPVRNAGVIPVPVSDFIGYPLPGRSFFFNVAIDHDFSNTPTPGGENA